MTFLIGAGNPALHCSRAKSIDICRAVFGWTQVGLFRTAEPGGRYFGSGCCRSTRANRQCTNSPRSGYCSEVRHGFQPPFILDLFAIYQLRNRSGANVKTAWLLAIAFHIAAAIRKPDGRCVPADVNLGGTEGSMPRCSGDRRAFMRVSDRADAAEAGSAIIDRHGRRGRRSSRRPRFRPADGRSLASDLNASGLAVRQNPENPG